MNARASISKLPNSPLQEVIFEMLLNQEVDANGNPTGESFDLAQGIFDKKVSKDFKHRVTIPSPLNFKIFPWIKHQYWTSKDQWPVVQIGPGILTINDTEVTYEWHTFYSLILQTGKRLAESYEKKLDIKKLALRYINAIALEDADAEQKLNFINTNFRIHFTNDFSIKGATLLGLNNNQTYELNDGSLVNLSLTDGESKENKPAIIWQIQVARSGVRTPEEIAEWLKLAHSIASNLFKDTLSPKFYESFK